MKPAGFLQNVIVRTVLGLAALLLLHLLVDFVSMQSREGSSKLTPYLFVALMYAWIVFHNRVLYDKLFLQQRKTAYFAWTGLAMLMFSLNMYYIITTSFHLSNPLPQIISFWIYTFAGLGIYVMWKNFINQETPSPARLDRTKLTEEVRDITTFSYMQDGQSRELPLDSIYYFESLENYVRIITARKPIVVRLTLKDAEANLPRPPFLRISRSHIANMNFVQRHDADTIVLASYELKVGKVYKKYVEAYGK